MRNSIFLCSVAALLTSPVVAVAQSLQAPKYSSRDEYRACLDKQDSLEPQRILRETKLDEHTAELKRLQDEMNAHVADQPNVDTDDQDAIDALMETLNARGKDLNRLGEDLNRETTAYNKQVAAMNKQCAGMVMPFKDRNAVLKERAAKGKK